MAISNLIVKSSLFVLAVLLLLAAHFKLISDHAIQRLANIAGIVAAVAGVLVFVVPNMNITEVPFSKDSASIVPDDMPTPTVKPILNTVSSEAKKVPPHSTATPTSKPTSTSTATPTVVPEKENAEPIIKTISNAKVNYQTNFNSLTQYNEGLAWIW